MLPAHPLAGSQHVLFRHSPVGAEHLLDRAVDPALQPVRSTGQRLSANLFNELQVEEGKQLPCERKIGGSCTALACTPVRPACARPSYSEALGTGNAVGFPVDPPPPQGVLGGKA